MTIFGRKYQALAVHNAAVAMVALVGLAAGALFSFTPAVVTAVVSAPVIG
jgi:hypothetical protein